MERSQRKSKPYTFGAVTGDGFIPPGAAQLLKASMNTMRVAFHAQWLASWAD